MAFKALALLRKLLAAHEYLLDEEDPEQELEIVHEALKEEEEIPPTVQHVQDHQDLQEDNDVFNELTK